MSEQFAVFLLMNNYFHDVATAMLPACGIVLWVILKNFGEVRDDALTRYAAALFHGVSMVFWFSVAWIVASGMVRIATFRSFEWSNAAQKHFEAGLFVKYVIAAVMMIVGSILWVRLSRQMRRKLGA